MEEELPRFARELLRRKNRSPNQNLFSQSLPKPLYPKESFDNYNENFSPQYLNDNQEELRELRDTISMLEQQIADLTQKKKSVNNLKSILEKEKNNTMELRNQLMKINDSIQEFNNKRDAFSEQITQLQSFLDNKQQFMDAKSGILSKLDEAYNHLKIDYENEMKKSSDQIFELNQLRIQIAELNDEATLLRSQKRAVSNNPPPVPNNNYFDFNQDDSFNFANPNRRNNLDEFRFAQNLINDPLNFPEKPIPVPDFNPIEFSEKNDNFNLANKNDGFNMANRSPDDPQVRASPVHAALYDNIKFGDDSEVKNDVIDDQEIDLGMSVNEMKNSLMQMQARKSELESLLNKSPPKQMKLAEARRERMKNESELSELEQKISKMRRALKNS